MRQRPPQASDSIDPKGIEGENSREILVVHSTLPQARACVVWNLGCKGLGASSANG
jgi:hypothetical protein